MRSSCILRRAACLAAALAVAAPVAAGANVQVGSSGWQWGNPLPQGNTIRAMAFASLAGYAAGDFGTLLRTTDAGATWAGLRSGTFTGLTEVQAIDSDSLFAGGGCVARRSDDGGTTFTRVAFTPVEAACKEQLAAAWFVNEQTAYLTLTDGTTLRTDNKGDTFAQRNPLPGTRAPGGPATPTDIVFTSDTVGVGATSDGRLYRTTDGANSWTLVHTAAGAVRSLVFVTSDLGYGVGRGTTFLKTEDGGAMWTSLSTGLPGGLDLRSIRCASVKLCAATTERGDQIVRTEDGGATAALVTPSQDPVYAAAFASGSRLVAAGANGATAASDDGGKTFAPIGGRLTGSYTRVRAGSAGNAAFAPGDNGSLAKTVDGGQTWTRGNVSTSEDVLDVAFPTNDAGYALDVAGGLFRTADGGATWKTLDTGTTARPAAVVAPTPQVVVLVGPTGLRRSTDAGGSFTTVTGRAVVKVKLSRIDTAPGLLIAHGARDIIRSADRGRTWKAIGRPSKRTSVVAVDFASGRVGFLLDAGGRVFRTQNGGRRWTELGSTGTEDAYGLAFTSATRGYLVIDRFGDVTDRSGFLLRTTDGGATWHPQFVVSTPIAATGVAATPNGTDYLLGGASSLLFSTTGGDAGGASTLSARTRRRRLGRPARLTVTGRLAPALGNERVTVSWRPPRSSAWRHQTVRTAANGSYTTSWDVRRGDNAFVAQWAGDFRNPGDGSKVLTVRVGR